MRKAAAHDCTNQIIHPQLAAVSILQRAVRFKHARLAILILTRSGVRMAVRDTFEPNGISSYLQSPPLQ